MIARALSMTCLACSLAVIPRLEAQETGPSSPEVLLEEAFYREVAAHDPLAAMDGYKNVLSAPSLPPRLAARARLRLGVCSYVLGQQQQAQRYFEQVIQEHPTEIDAVKLARRYLGQPVLEDPARFLPADVLFYAELVEPAEHIRALSELLKGTPFQNPVDYYLNYLSASSAGADADGAGTRALQAAPGIFHEASAVLNEGFLRDLQKMDGLALGVPGERKAKEDFLLVLLPGASNILRGTVQMELSRNNVPVVGNAHKLPLFRLPPGKEAESEAQVVVNQDDLVHLAMGDALGGEVILLGRPRRLVEDAVERYATRAPSLADDPDFRRAQSARAGSVVFAYLDRQRAYEALQAEARPQDVQGLEGAREILGWDRLHAINFTLSTSAATDSLRFALQGRLEARGFDAWEAFSTPPLDRELLRAVPPASLGWLATRLDRGPERWEAFHRMAERLIGLVPEEHPAEAKAHLDALNDVLASEPVRRFLAEVDGVVLCLGPRIEDPWLASFALVLRCRDPDSGQEALEEGMSAFFYHVLRNEASKRFISEAAVIDGRQLALRTLEPVPGMRFNSLRQGNLFVVSLSRELLLEAVKACERANDASAFPLPRGTAKALFLRPAALLQAIASGNATSTGPGLPPELTFFLAQVGEVLLSTREVGEHLSLELVLPQVTATARAILMKLPELRKDR